MRDSLRTRLVIWYAVVLSLVVGLYGGAVCYQSWRAMTREVDRELGAQARELASRMRPAADGRFDLELTPAASSFFRQEDHRPYYVIWAADGSLVDRSDPEIQPGGREMAGRRQMTAAGPRGSTVLVGREIGDLQTAQWVLVFNVVLAGGLTLALAICGGWFVAGRALSPIRKINDAARRMAAGEFKARIEVADTETELEQVASALNEAFDRLELAVEQERRFTADASHELRTPLSVLRAEVDWALDRERPDEQYRDSLAVCRRAALRMQDAVERMLALARAEAIPEKGERAIVSVQAMLEDVAGWLRPLAQERGVQVSVGAATFEVMADAVQLREALTNVVANAILYNKPGGAVTIASHASHGAIQIEIVDTGSGIPAAAVPHVFDRFFRVDTARSRDGGGSGLGLAIAQAVIAAHGGSIACTSEIGTGSVFAIVLPMADLGQEQDPSCSSSQPRLAAGSRVRGSRSV